MSSTTKPSNLSPGGQNLPVQVPRAFSRVGRSRWLPILVGLVAFAWAFATYLAVTDDTVSADSTAVAGLLIGNLTVLSVLGLLIARRLARLWGARREGAGASRLHVQLVTLFSIVAIVPTLVVALFSILFFELGLQNWFSSKVRTAVDNSVNIAQDYYQEYSKGIVLFVHSRSVNISDMC